MSKPLWEVMADAFMETGAVASWDNFPAMFSRCKAAEIRAIAAWIEQRQDDNYGCVIPDVREVIEWLTDEADRTERSD